MASELALILIDFFFFFFALSHQSLEQHSIYDDFLLEKGKLRLSGT